MYIYLSSKLEFLEILFHEFLLLKYKETNFEMFFSKIFLLCIFFVRGTPLANYDDVQTFKTTSQIFLPNLHITDSKIPRTHPVMNKWYGIYRSLQVQEGKNPTPEYKDVHSDLQEFKMESKDASEHAIAQDNDNIAMKDTPTLINVLGSFKENREVYHTAEKSEEKGSQERNKFHHTSDIDNVDLDNELSSNFTSNVQIGDNWKSMAISVFCGTQGWYELLLDACNIYQLIIFHHTSMKTLLGNYLMIIIARSRKVKNLINCYLYLKGLGIQNRITSLTLCCQHIHRMIGLC